MRTLAYEGPTIVHVHSAAADGVGPIDAVVQITATRMWADDHPLHEGRLDYAEGALVRHESLADVLEVGDPASVAQVGDVLYLRLNVACGRCEQCERGDSQFCLTAQPGADGRGTPDLTATAWSVRAPELDNAWQRINRLLQEHPAGMHSAPLSRSVLTAIGSQVPSGEEPPPDYRHFDRWDDGWAAVVLRPGGSQPAFG
jgi:threonine dehydrogenase-like Zn-dependent dehydrogenase